MKNPPPITSKINKGAEGGHEFERLMNQLLLCYADRNGFDYTPVGGAGGDRGIDGLASRGGVPGFDGVVAFQFKWLWDRVHKGSKARQISESFARATESDNITIDHLVLVTPHDLTPGERDWISSLSIKAELTLEDKRWLSTLAAKPRIPTLESQNRILAGSSSPSELTYDERQRLRAVASAFRTLTLDERNWLIALSAKPSELTSGQRGQFLSSNDNPYLLTTSDTRRLLALSNQRSVTVHHWGQSRIEGLLRDYCPSLLARYYPDEAKGLLAGYDGHDFHEFTRDYRRKTAIAHRRLRTIGLPPETLREQDATVEIPLHGIFVPLKLMLEDDDEHEVLTLGQLLGEGGNCVLLGDPGTGKTTILSFVALLFCGETNLGGFTPSAEVVPLVIPLRDIHSLRVGKNDLEFLEYLTGRARSDLNLPHAHQSYFEAKLRMGEAVVLVDGLDEAGGELSRQRLSTAIQTFQAEYPDCACWVTSRVYGYTRDVRLPSDNFDHYRVQRLDGSQIDDFVSRWYAIQYPENDRLRDERARSLQNAVHRSVSVRRLAGNPLLLTLMAFIHHGQRSLPQDRGELYEQCVQMLLKTWLKSKREDDQPLLQTPSHPFEKLALHVATQKDYLAHLAARMQDLNQEQNNDEGRGVIRRVIAVECLACRHLERGRRTRPEMELPEAREEMEYFVDFACDHVGLLVDKGGGYLSFLHLSFQEYLAAWVFTCRGVNEHEQCRFFNEHLGLANWEEVLLLRLYIILRLPGGGGEPVFDAVIASLRESLEHKPSEQGWLTLIRAVRDNLEFSSADRTTIINKSLGLWLDSRFRFDGYWYSALEDVCLFSNEGRSDLAALLRREWACGGRSRAVACVHLLDRLDLTHGRPRLSERPDIVENLCQLIMQIEREGGWWDTLSFLFGCIIDDFCSVTAKEWRQRVADSRSNNVWRLPIALGELLRSRLESDATPAEDLIAFFRGLSLQALEKEITVDARHRLALALGWISDPRIELDLQVRENKAYALIPAGTYRLGDERVAFEFQRPFLLSRFPITNSHYSLFIGDSGYSREELWLRDGWSWLQNSGITAPRDWTDPKFCGPNQPVVGVSWWEAEAFCRWAGGRLPSASESEAAGRGPIGFEYPWGWRDDWQNGLCNSHEVDLGCTSAVGIFPRSRMVQFGLEDMAGNVSEWCADEHSGWARVVRSGSWKDTAWSCRLASRKHLGPAYRADDLGFRLAADYAEDSNA